MREIKFRAWDKTRNCFHYGCSNIMLDMSGLKFWQFGFGYPSPIEKQDDYVIQQYTGLKDKNGKEIYEGDVVKVYSYFDEEDPTLNEFTLHEIVWGGDYPAFELSPTIADDCNSLQSSIYGCCGESVEVIGNIYENQGLLK